MVRSTGSRGQLLGSADGFDFRPVDEHEAVRMHVAAGIDGRDETALDQNSCH
jgi:hypothetical protein